MNLSWNQLCGKGIVGVLKVLEVSSGIKENQYFILGVGLFFVFRYKKMEFIEFYKNKEIFYDYKFIGIFLMLMFEKLNSDKRFLFWFFCFM